jgi:hypothetical protein
MMLLIGLLMVLNALLMVLIGRDLPSFFLRFFQFCEALILITTPLTGKFDSGRPLKVGKFASG